MGQSDRLIAMNNLKSAADQVLKAIARMRGAQEAASFYRAELSEETIRMYELLARVSTGLRGLVQHEYEQNRYDKYEPAVDEHGRDAPWKDVYIARFDRISEPAGELCELAQGIAERMREYNRTLTEALEKLPSPPPARTPADYTVTEADVMAAVARKLGKAP